jgi:hypothetical protein
MSAKEIAEPKELEYEVRSRLSSLFIPLIIALGFLLGYFVRVYLTNVIAVSAARDQASTLLARVTASLAERRDHIFRDTLKEERAALDSALANDDAAAMRLSDTDPGCGLEPAARRRHQRRCAAPGSER